MLAFARHVADGVEPETSVSHRAVNAPSKVSVSDPPGLDDKPVVHTTKGRRAADGASSEASIGGGANPFRAQPADKAILFALTWRAVGLCEALTEPELRRDRGASDTPAKRGQATVTGKDFGTSR